MGRGSGTRNPAYKLGQVDYADRVSRTLECPEGGWHDRNEEGLCVKCEVDLTPDLPPRVDEMQAPT